VGRASGPEPSDEGYEGFRLIIDASIGLAFVIVDEGRPLPSEEAVLEDTVGRGRPDTLAAGFDRFETETGISVIGSTAESREVALDGRELLIPVGIRLGGPITLSVLVDVLFGRAIGAGRIGRLSAGGSTMVDTFISIFSWTTSSRPWTACPSTSAGFELDSHRIDSVSAGTDIEPLG